MLRVYSNKQISACGRTEGTATVMKNVLGHLQRLIDIGGQDGKEVIYATDKKSTYETIREKQ